MQEDTLKNFQNYVIRCKNRDGLRLFLKEKNISSGVHYMPLHLHPFYKKLYPKIKLPVIESVWKELLTLPLYPQLTQKEQDYIINCIKSFPAMPHALCAIVHCSLFIVHCSLFIVHCYSTVCAPGNNSWFLSINLQIFKSINIIHTRALSLRHSLSFPWRYSHHPQSENRTFPRR